MIQTQGKPQESETVTTSESAGFRILEPTIGFLPREFFTEKDFQQYQKARNNFLQFVESLSDSNS